MKKVLSLFLTVALLFTLVPNVIASTEDAVAEPVKLAITADTVLDARYENSKYGMTPHGSDTAMFFSQAKPNNYETAPLLYKTAFSVDAVPEGKVVTKVELFVYGVAEGSKTQGNFTNNIRVFNASTTWDESTTYMKEWDTEFNNKAGFAPNVSWNKNAEGYSCQISAEPDAICAAAFKKFADTDTTPIAYSFDITPAFMAAYPNGLVSDGDEFSWMMAMTPDASYRYVTIASKEHSNTEVHPYLQITLADKLTMTVTDYEAPVNPRSAFELTTSNPIDDCSVTVNGEAIAEDAVSVVENKITLNYSWEIGEEYTVVVNATDVYGQTLPESTYTFTVTDSYIFPITGDTSLSGDNNTTMPNNKYGDDIWGAMPYIRMSGRTGASARSIGVLKTDALTGIKGQLDSGKLIDKVELLAYLAPGSLAINTTTRFFPASTDWPEETTTMLSWSNGSYQPKLIFSDTSGTRYGAFEEDAVPTDNISYSYPKAENEYVPVTYDITNTFNKAFEAGVAEDSVFSFMMALAETTSTWNYVFLASSEDTSYAPIIKITLKEKKFETTDTTADTGLGYLINATGSKSLGGFGSTAYYFDSSSPSYNASAVAAYTIPLPEIPDGKYLESLKMTFCQSDTKDPSDNPDVLSAYINVYRYIPDGSVDLTALKFSDLAEYAVKSNRTGKVSATGYTAVRPGTVAGNTGHSFTQFVVDLTEYAYECIEAGKDEMIVIMNCNYALPFCGTKSQMDSSMKDYDIGAEYTASIASNPELTLADSQIDVGGSIVDASEFKFRTQLKDNAVANAKLYKGSELIEEAVFSLTPSKTKLVLEPITLEENASYRAVLLAGAEDLYGNVSETDIELASFETITNRIVSVPKIVTEDFDAETDSFSDAFDVDVTISSGTKIKAITEITNNTSKNDEIIVAVVAYKGGEIKSVSAVSLESSSLTAKATRVYNSDTITLDEDCDSIKAFVLTKENFIPLSASKVVNLAQ